VVLQGCTCFVIFDVRTLQQSSVGHTGPISDVGFT
jgi:hypothetical protein